MTGWPRARLGDLCEIQIGRTPPRAEPRYWGPGHRWLSIADMNQGRDLVTTKETITEAAVQERNCRLVPAGTLVFSFKLSVGKVGFVRKQMFTNEAIAALLVRNDRQVDAGYLYHALGAIDFRGVGERAVKGVTLNTNSVANLPVPLPPLAEQRRIAAVLDKADALRRKRRESLRLLDEFLRSAFLQMFGDAVMHPGVRDVEPGWRLVTVEEIAAKSESACAGGPFGSSLTRADYVPAPGVPVIRGGNLVADRGVFRDEDFVYVTEAKCEELSRNLAYPGDIVFTQRGTLGQVARIPQSPRHARYVISQSQMKLTVNEDVADPTYVVYYFLSPRARLDLESRTLATGVPHINLSILKAFLVVLPPLILQRRFAALVSRHLAVTARLEAAGRHANELFDSLARRAFWGKS